MLGPVSMHEAERLGRVSLPDVNSCDSGMCQSNAARGFSGSLVLLRDSQRHNEVLQAFCLLKHPQISPDGPP